MWCIDVHLYMCTNVHIWSQHSVQYMQLYSHVHVNVHNVYTCTCNGWCARQVFPVDESSLSSRPSLLWTLKLCVSRNIEHIENMHNGEGLEPRLLTSSILGSLACLIPPTTISGGKATHNKEGLEPKATNKFKTHYPEITGLSDLTHHNLFVVYMYTPKCLAYLALVVALLPGPWYW